MSGAQARVADDDEDDIPLRSNGGGQQQRQGDDDDGQQAGGGQYGGFQIIDTDDDLRPLKQDGEEREDSLSQENVDEGSLLDQRRQRDGQDYADERRHMTSDQKARQRRSSRQRQRDARDRSQAYTRELEAQVLELRGLVQGITPRLDAHDRARMQDQVSALTGNIETQEAIAAAAKARMIDAMQNGDHQAVADAMDQRDAAVREGARLSSIKAQAEQNLRSVEAGDPGRQGQGQGQGQRQDNGQRPAPRLSPDAERNSNSFFQRHGWINRSNLEDPETKELLALDRLVHARGYKAETPEYWDALEDEMRNSPVIGYRFDDDDDRPAPRNGREQRDDGRRQQPAQQRRGPMVGGGAERPAQRGNNDNRVYLSPSRKDALIAANVMDSRGNVVDPAKFARVMKSYQDFDRDNPPSRA